MQITIDQFLSSIFDRIFEKVMYKKNDAFY